MILLFCWVSYSMRNSNLCVFHFQQLLGEGTLYQVRLRVRKITWPSRNYKVRVHQQSHKTSSSTLMFTLLTFISSHLFDMPHTCTLTQSWWLSLNDWLCNVCVVSTSSKPYSPYIMQSYKIYINERSGIHSFLLSLRTHRSTSARYFTYSLDLKARAIRHIWLPFESHVLLKSMQASEALWKIRQKRTGQWESALATVKEWRWEEERQNERTEHSGAHDAEQTEWIREEKLSKCCIKRRRE